MSLTPTIIATPVLAGPVTAPTTIVSALEANYILVCIFAIFIIVRLISVTVGKKITLLPVHKWVAAFVLSVGAMFLGVYTFDFFTQETSLNFLVKLLEATIGSAGLADLKGKVIGKK